MATKKTVPISPRPDADRAQTPSLDDWVQSRDVEPKEPTKRLTIDIPARLHARLKSQCALRDVKMADAVRALLEKYLSED